MSAERPSTALLFSVVDSANSWTLISCCGPHSNLELLYAEQDTSESAIKGANEYIDPPSCRSRDPRRIGVGGETGADGDVSHGPNAKDNFGYEGLERVSNSFSIFDDSCSTLSDACYKTIYLCNWR